MTINVREAIQKMKSKGFVEEKGDHKFLRFVYKGRKTRIRTKFSHSHGDIGIQLISKVAKQLHITNKELQGVIDCSCSEEDLIENYKRKSII